MLDPLPLPTLLSQVLVAFTIEFDNEFEHRMPYRATASGPVRSQDGPWLASMVMWSNFMQFVAEEGVTVGEIQNLARTEKLSLAGMERWGYVVVEAGPADGRPRAPRSEWVARPTAKGKMAQEVWWPLVGVIESRWEARFGVDQIGRLRESLAALVGRLDVELPEYLPVVGYGLFTPGLREEGRGRAVRGEVVSTRLPLTVLLSRVLLALTMDFEHDSDLSLAVCANVVRLLSEDGVRARDLPRLSGVSKEAISMSLGFLEKRGCIVVEPDPTAARTKLVRLTPKGREAQDAYIRRLGLIEKRWRERFGDADTLNLRESLERLVGAPTAQLSPLFRGLEPYPEGWRASVPRPTKLPHHPMVLHRGGYPDGS